MEVIVELILPLIALAGLIAGVLAIYAYLVGILKASDLGRWLGLSGGTTEELVERNRDIIISYLGKVQAHSDTDNLTKDCISEIARREKRTELVPNFRERLRQWEERPYTPTEWREMKAVILKALDAKRDVVSERKRKEDAEERKIVEDRDALRRHQLYHANKDLIDKFLEIAERKVSIVDEYGDENWDALPPEIETCITKIAKRNGYSDKVIKEAFRKGFFLSKLPDDYEWLKAKLNQDYREYHQSQKAKPASAFKVDGLTGVEFETWVAKLLIECGFEISGTPATGDQGADLIAKKNGKTIIIQAKRYQGTVGNKAVQEVISAVAYYRGDEGWVITNSFFTPSAKALAHRSNIRLIDGRALEQGMFD